MKAMQKNTVNNFIPLRKYTVLLREEHKYTTMAITIEEAEKDYSESIVTIPSGTILWSQDNSFTIEQVAEAKKDGFPYQWGFGPCCERIPFNKIQFAKIETIEV